MSVSCRIYQLLIDPLLRSLRKEIALMIPQGSSVIELGSGTGAQARALSSRCSRYVGIDLNPDFSSCADRRFGSPGYEHLEFRAADGRDLHFIGDDEFDVAMITLALHEMPHQTRLQVLSELKRISRTIIIADYSTPLPPSLPGRFSHAIERLAGGAHYAGFRHYQQIGGISELLDQAGLTELSRSRLLYGVATVVRCS